MKRLVLIEGIVFCQPVLAESWKCTTEIAVAVTLQPPYKSAIATIGDKYIIFSDPETNKYYFSEAGEPPNTFMNCALSENELTIRCEFNLGGGRDFQIWRPRSTFRSTTVVNYPDGHDDGDWESGDQTWFKSEVGSCEFEGTYQEIRRLSPLEERYKTDGESDS